MSEDKVVKNYRRKLREVRGTIKKTKKLMESEREEIALEAIDLFMQLSEMEISLIVTIEEMSEYEGKSSSDGNPLARRRRLGR